MEVRENLAGSGPKQAAREHLEELLDEALMATFPASDPIAVGRELLEVVEQQLQLTNEPPRSTIEPGMGPPGK